MPDDAWSELVAFATAQTGEWEAGWPAFAADETVDVNTERARAVLSELAVRLQDNYPFFHPLYAGQMLKPPHPIAAAAYAMAQRINPNAHALDGGPATARLEMEVVRSLARMCGYDADSSLGHLTSSGTIANLEALWVARESLPTQGIAYSRSAHYTHERMCQVLRTDGVAIEATLAGRMDLDALEDALKTGRVGTVVATAGTTSLGAVDPVAEIIKLARRYGVRVHVDAAYGGFFQLMAHDANGGLRAETMTSLAAIANADSVVIDPHKHGLQPYGCGSVLFRDANVGRFYKHDSPYTYFTSDDLHLGEISLECSRAGAAAAALWATLEALPLESKRGIGAILRKTRSAAVKLARLIDAEPAMRLVVDPELDIVGFYCLPGRGSNRVSDISALTRDVFDRLMDAPPSDQLFLATLRIGRGELAIDDLDWDMDQLLVFRSVLMKPEHLDWVEHLVDRVRAVSGAAEA